VAHLDQPFEVPVAEWRAFARRRRIPPAQVEAVEVRLRGALAALAASGLAADEALVVALTRIGDAGAPAHEFARTFVDRVWKSRAANVAAPSDASRTDARVALGLAVAAALATRTPELAGVRIDGPDGIAMFYARNLSLFAFPFVAIYFAWKRQLPAAAALWLALPFAAAALFANVFPFAANSDTQALTVLHLPIALWLAVGVAATGARWFADGARMDFVRFSGELAISYVLIALGGGVFIGFTAMMFTAIGIRPDWLIARWVLPCGGVGAVVVATWLAETRLGVADSMAPVLTRIFTPLFTLLLVAFLATMAWTGRPIDVKREMLIGFDLLLVLVVGLVLYAASSRRPLAPPDGFDRLQLALVMSALAVDALALAAIGARISEFGFTANRVAALGENIILLGNLAWTAWLYARFVFGRGRFDALERWQLAYLPVYSLWAALVVIVFPLLFG
jgi:hypothetical protein